MSDSEMIVAARVLGVMVFGVFLRDAINRIVTRWGQSANAQLWDRVALGILAALVVGIVLMTLRVTGVL